MGMIQDIVEWLRAQAAAANADGFVFGLSGGIDSAVVARLCQLAKPGNVLGVIMPCYSNPQDAADAKLVAAAFSLPTKLVVLSDAYEALRSSVAVTEFGSAERDALAFANIKPRLRMTTLYVFASAMNYLVVGTGNRSEIEIGYYTKYGDGGVDLLPIGDLVKSEVRALAVELQVPPAVCEKAPSAGLWSGQTDEGEMGFSYAELETCLSGGILPSEVVGRIRQMHDRSAHKRSMPPVFVRQ